MTIDIGGSKVQEA